MRGGPDLRPNPERQKRGAKAREEVSFLCLREGRPAGELVGLERGVRDEIREEGRCHDKKSGL